MAHIWHMFGSALHWNWSGRVEFKAQEDASSAIVQHSLNVFRPNSGASFLIIRNLLVTFPFLV